MVGRRGVSFECSEFFHLFRGILTSKPKNTELRVFGGERADWVTSGVEIGRRMTEISQE